MHDGNKWLRKGGDDGAPLSTGISESMEEKFQKLLDSRSTILLYTSL